MTRKSVYIATAAAFLLISAAPARAQTTARIFGIVRDETGSTVRGAIIRAETGDASTGSPVSLTSATDERGRFVFIVTRSGVWRLTFEAPGFETVTIAANVRLGGSPPNLDVKLDRHESPESVGAMAGIDIKLLSTQLATASTLLEEGRYDEAIAAYRDIKTKAPVLTLVNLQLGNAYLMKKSYPEAEAAFQEILKSSADDANGLFAMGTVKEAQGNASDAASWYQRASKADAFWTRPLMKLAGLARQGGDRAAAAKYLTQVIDLDPSSPDATQAVSMQRELQ